MAKPADVEKDVGAAAPLAKRAAHHFRGQDHGNSVGQDQGRPGVNFPEGGVFLKKENMVGVGRDDVVLTSPPEEARDTVEDVLAGGVIHSDPGEIEMWPAFLNSSRRHEHVGAIPRRFSGAWGRIQASRPFRQDVAVGHSSSLHPF
jgi:hypothetical protein